MGFFFNYLCVCVCGAEICSGQTRISRLNLAGRSESARVKKFLQRCRRCLSISAGLLSLATKVGRVANGEFTVIKSSGRKWRSQKRGDFDFFFPL